MSADMSREIPDYVAAYLLERILSLLPDEVVTALGSLTPDQINGLRAVGEALQASDAEPMMWVFGVH
jgi:hypothetical protein